MRSRSLPLLIVFLLSSVHLLAQVSLGTMNVTDYNAPKDYYLGGMTVSGVKYLDGNVLLMLSGLTVGDKIKVPGDKISQAIRKLWEQGLFEDIRVSVTKVVEDQIFIDFYLKERPRLSKFQFNGIKKSDADDIRQKISLVKGDYVTDNMIMKTRNIITKFYNDKGYLNAEVDIVQKRDSATANEVTLFINIDRNEKVKVYNIQIHGNKNLSEDMIKAAFKKTKEKSVFNPMDDLDQVVYETAKEAVTIDFVEIGNVLGDHVSDHVRFRIFKSS